MEIPDGTKEKLDQIADPVPNYQLSDGRRKTPKLYLDYARKRVIRRMETLRQDQMVMEIRPVDQHQQRQS